MKNISVGLCKRKWEKRMESIEELLSKYKRYEMPELIQYLKQQKREEEVYQSVQEIIQKANGYDMLGIIRALTNTQKGKEYYTGNSKGICDKLYSVFKRKFLRRKDRKSSSYFV